MLPNVNPKQMQKMMKQMGMKQEDVDAVRVVIETNDANIVLNDPSVSLVNMMGQDTFQVSGEYEVEKKDHSPTISDEDVETVVSQTGVTEEVARETIESVNGDLAEAILKLRTE